MLREDLPGQQPASCEMVKKFDRWCIWSYSFLQKGTGIRPLTCQIGIHSQGPLRLPLLVRLNLFLLLRLSGNRWLYQSQTHSMHELCLRGPVIQLGGGSEYIPLQRVQKGLDHHYGPSRLHASCLLPPQCVSKTSSLSLMWWGLSSRCLRWATRFCKRRFSLGSNVPSFTRPAGDITKISIPQYQTRFSMVSWPSCCSFQGENRFKIPSYITCSCSSRDSSGVFIVLQEPSRRKKNLKGQR